MATENTVLEYIYFSLKKIEQRIKVEPTRNNIKQKDERVRVQLEFKNTYDLWPFIIARLDIERTPGKPIFWNRYD
jgi:hypothetical protein